MLAILCVREGVQRQRAVKKHESRLRASLPPNGSIRLLALQKSSTSLFRFFWEIISRKKPLLYVNS